MSSSLLIILLLLTITITYSLQLQKNINKNNYKRTYLLKASTLLDNENVQKEYLEYQINPSKRPYKEDETQKLMQFIDIGKSDNFYSGTYSQIKKKRQQAIQDKDINKRIQVDESFQKLMLAGFNKRFNADVDAIKGENYMTFIDRAAQKTSNEFELSKTKEEQFKELKKKELQERSGYMKMIPQGLHKYIDYVLSLSKKPNPADITRNMVLSAFFSFIIYSNAQVRAAFMYFVIGNGALMSALLTRGMPQIKAAPGVNKRKIVNWSSSSFKTASGISLLVFIFPTALLTFSTLSLFPVSNAVKAKAAMIAALNSHAYGSSFFEVFEEKSKNGWRWAKAMEGSILPEDIQKTIASKVFETDKKQNDRYDYLYDPQIDDYPPVPKFIDDLPENIAKQGDGSGDHDEGVALQAFEQWKIERKNARRPPVEDVPPETPWVGSKEGMYVKNVPTWLSTAYDKNVLGANKWRGKPQRYKKDTTEFEGVEGPFGFRDKRPDWLDLFGTGVWEEKTQASRRAARSYGTYRKSMFKVDNQVVLQSCDGADK
jgi:hypothetical protein